MSPPAPGGNVGEHERFQFGAGVGCHTVRFGCSKTKWDENNCRSRDVNLIRGIKSRKMGECDDTVPK